MNEQPCILVVDDDDALRLVIRRTLQSAGYRIAEAADGRQAYRELSRQRVDLVITDIIMPDVEGIELILHLRRDYPRLPILAVSGGGRISPEDYLLSARRCGATSTLTKPFEVHELLTQVAALLPAQSTPAVEVAAEPAVAIRCPDPMRAPALRGVG